MTKIYSTLVSVASFLRLPNVLLIALLCLIFRFSFLARFYSNSNIGFQLDDAQFALLVFDIILVSWLGYWLNDWRDRAIDKVNKPNRLLVRWEMSKPWFFILIAITALLALGISLHLAVVTDNVDKLALLPIMVFLLAAYALRFKAYKPVGNILVSFLVVSILGLLALAELRSISRIPQTIFWSILLTISGILFLLNLTREIVKDIQDMSGDKLHAIRSIPIILGQKRTIFLIKTLLLLCLLLLVFIAVSFITDVVGLSLIVFSILLVMRCFQLTHQFSAAKARKLSGQLKLIMLVGILLLAFLNPI